MSAQYDVSLYFIIFFNIALACAAYIGTNLYAEHTRPTGRRYYRYIPFRINAAELACILAIALLLPLGQYELARTAKFTDREFLSGSIVTKEGPVVGKCNCRNVCREMGEDEDGDPECKRYEEVCDYPCYSWYLKTDYDKFFPGTGSWSFGPTYQPAGPSAPAEWNNAFVGQAACSVHTYSNTLRASENSTLKPAFSPIAESLAKDGLIPPRPVSLPFKGLYEGYRALWTGFKPPISVLGSSVKLEGNNYALTDISRYLMTSNQLLGPGVEGRVGKQGNLVIYLTDYPSPDWADAVYYKHDGGSKNDISVYVGLNSLGKVVWSTVKFGLEGQDMSEDVGVGSNERLRLLTNRYLKDKVVTDTKELVNSLTDLALDNFNRKPNKDFAYLIPSVRPSYGAIVANMLFTTLLIVVLSFVFYAKDPFTRD